MPEITKEQFDSLKGQVDALEHKLKEAEGKSVLPTEEKRYEDIPYYRRVKIDTIEGQPSFTQQSGARMYLNTAPQVFTDGVVAKVTLNAITYDVLTEADITTDNRFVAKQSGYYQINGAVYFATTVAAKRYAAKICKNGAVYSQVTNHSSNTGLIGVMVSDIIWLDTDDYLELWARHDAGENQSVTNGATLTYLSIRKIA